MKCHECNADMEEYKEDYQYTESGLDNIVLGNISVYKCKECGELYPTIPSVISLHTLIGKLLLKKRAN